MAVGDMTQTKERPAYVKFDKVAVEDVEQTRVQGRYVAHDVDMAYITPPGTKDIFKIEVAQWIVNMRQDVANDRLPALWQAQYLEAYKLWQTGQEPPLNGTAIKGWGVLTPAQQGLLISLMILTVEDLAQINDEGIQRIGMGGIDLRNKAKAWLAQTLDKGPLTVENTQLKQALITQQGEIDTLKAQVEALMAKLTVLETPLPSRVSVPDDIELSIDVPEPSRKRR